MTTDTTTAPAPATISKKELWALFVSTKIKHSLNVGNITLSSYTPDDLLREYGDMGVDLSDFTDRLADEIADDDDPLDALGAAAEVIGGFLANLKVIRDDFSRLADALETDDDVPGDEVRYRRPSSDAEQGEAA